MGFFVKKSGPFLNAGCIIYSISIFLHFTYLGGIRTPPAYGPGVENSKNQSAQVYLDDIH